MQAPGGVRVALAGTLDDPSIELAYRSAESALYTDAYGRPVDVAADGRRAVTEVLHEGRPVAAVVHDRALLRDPGLMEEAVSAARIAIENERFGIEMTTQLERLRASRARIVAAGDEERRRLERDLHDGAQQRLVGLLLGLRMLRAQLPPAEQAKVDEAESGVRHALADLRSLAHGIFPAALADEGLAAAVELLVDQSKAEIAVRKLPRGRFTPAVETAAYLVVAETLDRTAPVQADVEASRLGNELVVEVWSDGRPTEPFTDLEDRVGALGGRLAVTDDQGVRVRAVLPCG
jgi:signal transduction histidine kinase